jgi:hypothetical protein
MVVAVVFIARKHMLPLPPMTSCRVQKTRTCRNFKFRRNCTFLGKAEMMKDNEVALHNERENEREK